MRQSVIAPILALCLGAGPAPGESLVDRLSDGASKAAKSVRGAAGKAGSAIGGVAARVEETVDSTVHMATNEGTPEEIRAEIDAIAEASLGRLFAEHPGAVDLFDLSAGYAVFDTRRLTVLGLTGGFGRGVAVSLDDGARHYMRMGTGGVGFSFGFGGFVSQVVILFQDDWTFQHFVTSGFDATATAGTMLGEDRQDASLGFTDGRSIFVLTDKGWKVSATAAGTKYWRDAHLN